MLALVVARPPRRLLRQHRRPVLAGAAAAAALSVTVTAAALPLRAIARERAKDVGLVTQSWTGYAGDVAKGAAIGAVLAGAGGALLVFGMRRFGRAWWAPGAAVVVLFGVLTTYATPVVLDPLFNKFTPLPDGPTRTAVFQLAREAGVDVGEVYEIDASRRTTAANAYVAGLGRTKRVVLYDNLLKDFTPAEVRLVVAHELGHVNHRDVPHGLLWLAIVSPFGMLAIAMVADRLAPGRRGTAAAVPAVVLAVSVIAPAITVISNQLSRKVEARADSFALELTGEEQTFIDFQRNIAIKNVSEPDPPEISQFLLGTHPTTMERIGLARACAGALVVLGRLPALDLGQVLDALGGAPLGPVVLHGVEQLAHEPGRQVDPRDDDARDLPVLDLVVDARERDAELVVRVRDVGEVGVGTRHRLRSRVEVDLALGDVACHPSGSIAHVRYTVLAVGKVRAPYADDVEHYLRLLARQARVDVIEVADDDAVARRIPERAFVSLLDDGGETYSSEGFARWLEQRRQAGRDVCFVVGGAFGTSLERCDHRLSLGPMTLPHQLARVVLLEQLFRAHKILAGEPYHH